MRARARCFRSSSVYKTSLAVLSDLALASAAAAAAKQKFSIGVIHINKRSSLWCDLPAHSNRVSASSARRRKECYGERVGVALG